MALPLGCQFARALALAAELDPQRSTPKLQARKRVAALASESMWGSPVVSFPEAAVAAGASPMDVAALAGQRSTAAFQQRELQGVTRIGESLTRAVAWLHQATIAWRGVVADRGGRYRARLP